MPKKNPLSASVFDDRDANPLQWRPSAADAYSYNAPIVADAWKAAQDPQTWVDAANQWGQAMIGGTEAPGEGAIFHRFTNGGPDNGAGYMMFAKNADDVMHYGSNHYTVDTSKIDPKTIVDSSSPKFQAKIATALKKDPDLVGSYQATPKDLAAQAAPANIVDSAGLWDAPDLVSHVWDHVMEPNGWTAVKTPDGVVSFDPAHARLMNPD